MSYAARARAQRHQARKPKPERADIHRYDPNREVACRALGLAYGEVFVDRSGSVERSHEIGSSRDTSVFIDGRAAYNDRQERDKYRTDESWKQYETAAEEEAS